MNDPRERLLAETIKNKLVGIQKSKEIYEQFPKGGSKILRMSEKEMDKVSKTIASKVHRWCMRKKNAGNPLVAEEINRKVKEELEKL